MYAFLQNVPMAVLHFVVAAMLGQHRAQWMLGDALHSSTSFLATYLTKYQYSANQTHLRHTDQGQWTNDQDGYTTIANASIEHGIHVNISGSVVHLPLAMSCDWSVEYLRPLAETRAAGTHFRQGVHDYLHGDRNQVSDGCVGTTRTLNYRPSKCK
jgi:hypothetical protein